MRAGIIGKDTSTFHMCTVPESRQAQKPIKLCSRLPFQTLFLLSWRLKFLHVQYSTVLEGIQVTSTGSRSKYLQSFKSLRHDVMTQDGRQTFQRGVNARMTVIWDVSIRMWLKPGLVWTKFQHSANLQHWSRAYNRVSVKIAAETHQSIFSSSLSRRVAGSNGWVHTPSIKPKKNYWVEHTTSNQSISSIQHVLT